MLLPDEVKRMKLLACKILREAGSLNQDSLSADGQASLCELITLCKLSIRVGVRLEAEAAERGRLFDAILQPRRN